MIQVDHAGATPAFEQIREQVAGLIRLGSLPSGHRLPSIRQLAADLGLAPGTVARAYAELEDASLITTSRSGAFVRSGNAPQPTLVEEAARFADAVRTAGLSLEDAIAALRIGWTG